MSLPLQSSSARSRWGYCPAPGPRRVDDGVGEGTDVAAVFAEKGFHPRRDAGGADAFRPAMEGDENQVMALLEVRHHLARHRQVLNPVDVRAEGEAHQRHPSAPDVKGGDVAQGAAVVDAGRVQRGHGGLPSGRPEVAGVVVGDAHHLEARAAQALGKGRRDAEGVALRRLLPTLLALALIGEDGFEVAEADVGLGQCILHPVEDVARVVRRQDDVAGRPTHAQLHVAHRSHRQRLSEGGDFVARRKGARVRKGVDEAQLSDTFYEPRVVLGHLRIIRIERP